jgi:hypothetical protein
MAVFGTFEDDVIFGRPSKGGLKIVQTPPDF